MNTSWKNLSAMGCSILYILLYLFLPIIAVKLIGIGLTGMTLFSVSIWSYLPLAGGIAMAICALIAPPKVSGIVCIIGTFIPLITYLIVNSDILNGVVSLSGVPGIGSAISIGSGAILTVGAGVILPMLLGICATVFCFLPDTQIRKSTERTAGFSAGSDDEW